MVTSNIRPPVCLCMLCIDGWTSGRPLDLLATRFPTTTQTPVTPASIVSLCISGLHRDSCLKEMIVTVAYPVGVTVDSHTCIPPAYHPTTTGPVCCRCGKDDVFSNYIDLQEVAEQLGYRQYSLMRLAAQLLHCLKYKSKKVSYTLRLTSACACCSIQCLLQLGSMRNQGLTCNATVRTAHASRAHLWCRICCVIHRSCSAVWQLEPCC